MMEETKKTWYSTGGVTAALLLVVVALRFAGIFESPAVQ